MNNLSPYDYVTHKVVRNKTPNTNNNFEFCSGPLLLQPKTIWISSNERKNRQFMSEQIVDRVTLP